MLFYGLLGLLLGLLAIIAIVVLSNYERRRFLYIRWARATHYEFWPTSIFYFPAFVYYIFLCLRYRSLGLLSIVNPGMPPKHMYQTPKAIDLAKLAGKDFSYVARFCSLPAGQNKQWLSLTQAFIKQQKIKFPLVVKPQMGVRGADINIAHSLNELKQVFTKLESQSGDYMAQEYVHGKEFGVLYFRLPQSPHGQVTSVARKKPVYISGNGRDSLRRLILADKRACLMFHIYFKLYKDRLAEIPPSGEVVRLTQLGTHSRGAIFCAANHLLSNELTKRIDEISKNYQGFYLGRYDIISESEETLKRGESFKIIELNGLLGEPADMYDPANSLWRGYKMLFGYFRLAVRIAAENLAAGHQPLPWRAFLSTSLRAYRTLL